MYYYQILLQRLQKNIFIYSYPQLLSSKIKVLVNFNNKTMTGFIYQSIAPENIHFLLTKIKNITEIFPHCVVADSTMALAEFIASYYHAPLAQALYTALPPLTKSNTKFINHKISKALVSSNYKLTPNSQQQKIIETININLNNFYPSLLFGITGSGKTLVYLEIINQVLSNGAQALILIPEINLTILLLERCQQRFPQYTISYNNSAQSPKIRNNLYAQAHNGEIDIVLSTRSGIFIPFKNLGIIIVDEEHDSSYKQNNRLRYHARDVAVWRAKYHNIPILLGSATPSMETLYNCFKKKYQLFKLTTRAHPEAQLPQIIFLTPQNHLGLNFEILRQIKNTIAKQEITMVFINRRGYGLQIKCFDCGIDLNCINCSSNLIYHHSLSILKCHYCNFKIPIPKSCPNCNSSNLKIKGEGSQQIEEQLIQALVGARIIRIDRDSVTTKTAWEKIYQKIYQRKVDVLVGTQMLSKGHDFPNISLVVCLNVDCGLFSQDFRASEFLYSQLTQISGRAGRGDKSAKVLIETKYPNHEIFQLLQNNDYNKFTQYIFKIRQTLELPPFSYLATIKAQHSDYNKTLNYLTQIHQYADSLMVAELNIFPIASLIMARIKNQYHLQFLVSTKSRTCLHQFLTQVTQYADTVKGAIGLTVDVDPLMM